MKVLLSIDLSTTCTGWSVHNLETKELVTYGTIKGKSFNKETSSQRATLKKMEHMAVSILQLVKDYKPTKIVIEEIAGSKNRIGQKTLDMCHGIVWFYIEPYLDIVEYYDVSGADGWRTNLNLKLSEQDKLNNKEARKINKDLGKGVTKMPIYDYKDLACRFVNEHYGLSLDPQASQKDADIGDSIALGHAYIKFKYRK